MSAGLEMEAVAKQKCRPWTLDNFRMLSKQYVTDVLAGAGPEATVRAAQTKTEMPLNGMICCPVSVGSAGNC